MLNAKFFDMLDENALMSYLASCAICLCIILSSCSIQYVLIVI